MKKGRDILIFTLTAFKKIYKEGAKVYSYYLLL